MIVMKSQHDPTEKQIIVVAPKSTTKLLAHWADRATKYPRGVFQLNGNLKVIKPGKLRKIHPFFFDKSKKIEQYSYITGKLKK